MFSPELVFPPEPDDPPEVMSPPELVFPPELVLHEQEDPQDVTFAAFAMACVIISCTWLMVMYGDSGSVGAAEETIRFLTLKPST